MRRLRQRHPTPRTFPETENHYHLHAPGLCFTLMAMLRRLFHLLLCLALLSAPLAGMAGAVPAVGQGGDMVMAAVADHDGSAKAAVDAAQGAAPAAVHCNGHCPSPQQGDDCCNTGGCAFCGHCVSAVLPMTLPAPVFSPQFLLPGHPHGLVTRAIAPPHRPPLALQS